MARSTEHSVVPSHVARAPLQGGVTQRLLPEDMLLAEDTPLPADTLPLPADVPAENALVPPECGPWVEPLPPLTAPLAAETPDVPVDAADAGEADEDGLPAEPEVTPLRGAPLEDALEGALLVAPDALVPVLVALEAGALDVLARELALVLVLVGLLPFPAEDDGPRDAAPEEDEDVLSSPPGPPAHPMLRTSPKANPHHAAIPRMCMPPPCAALVAAARHAPQWSIACAV